MEQPSRKYSYRKRSLPYSQLIRLEELHLVHQISFTEEETYP